MTAGRTGERLRGGCGRFLLLALATFFALVFGEVLVRAVAPQQLILLRGDIWIPDQIGLGWRVAPHLDTLVNTGEREVRLLTDEDGYRIGIEPRPRVAASEPSLRILALGDSFLAAIQVAYEDTVTARLESALSKELGRAVTVVNTGVSGWEANRYWLLAREEFSRRPADLALVFLFRGNDILTDERVVFPPRQGKVVHRLRWPRSLARDELVESFLQPLNDSLERRSHLFILARKAGWQALMHLGLSARRFPIGELRTEVDSARWQITGQFCQEIDATARAHGAAALFVFVPGAYHVDPQLGAAYARSIGLEPEDFDLTQTSRLLGAELERRGLNYVDATDTLSRAHRQGVVTHGRVDTHLSPEGHALLADLLQEPIQGLLRRRGAAIRDDGP